MRPRNGSEEGFTLVELLVAMTISGMIMAALGSAVYVGLRTTAGNQRSLVQSNAEQLVATWFAADVGAACNPALSAPSCARSPNPSSSSGSACGTAALFALDTVSSPTASAADTTVAYVLQNSVLTRITCAYGATSAASTSTLATNVTSATVSYPTTGACSGQFRLDLTIAGTALGNGTTDYSSALCARRRA